MEEHFLRMEMEEKLHDMEVFNREIRIANSEERDEYERKFREFQNFQAWELNDNGSIVQTAFYQWWILLLMKKNDQGRDEEIFDKQLKRSTFEEWKSRTARNVRSRTFMAAIRQVHVLLRMEDCSDRESV